MSFFSPLDGTAQYGIDKAGKVSRLSGKVRRVAGGGWNLGTCRMAWNWQLRTKDYESPFSAVFQSDLSRYGPTLRLYADAGDNGLKSSGRRGISMDRPY